LLVFITFTKIGAKKNKEFLARFGSGDRECRRVFENLTKGDSAVLPVPAFLELQNRRRHKKSETTA
jgi:hypothetical protein